METLQEKSKLEMQKLKELKIIDTADLYKVLIWKQIVEAKTFESREGILGNIFNEITIEAERYLESINKKAE
jgi:hypothetical protein